MKRMDTLRYVYYVCVCVEWMEVLSDGKEVETEG